MGFEGKVWNLVGGRLVLWGFEEKNGASDNAAIVKIWEADTEKQRFGCLV